MSDEKEASTTRVSDRSHPATPPPVDIRPVLLDHRAESPVAFHCAGAGVFVLEEGLNLVDAATWATVSKHPPIVARLGKELHRVDLGSMTAEERHDLIRRTRNQAALGHLLASETAKPLVSGPANRRDQTIVAAIQHKLSKARRKPAKV